MSEELSTSSNKTRRFIGAGLAIAGALILVGLAVFITVALNYRASFTGSLPPFLDFAEAMAILSPVILLALLFIGYGRRLLRKG
ncbi:MAG: hypothetical protein K8S25_05560 [Alphaproteobacteria bacterium]|nr:hypothetical protein [Alphaproteobacteria bacterium]